MRKTCIMRKIICFKLLRPGPWPILATRRLCGRLKTYCGRELLLLFTQSTKSVCRLKKRTFSVLCRVRVAIRLQRFMTNTVA